MQQFKFIQYIPQCIQRPGFCGTPTKPKIECPLHNPAYITAGRVVDLFWLYRHKQRTVFCG